MPGTERGPGGWPIDPEAAFHEAQGKFHEARKEADHWRANHADLLRRFKIAQTFRGDLEEGAALLRRVAGESRFNLWGDLSRAIDTFLADVSARLLASREGEAQ